MEGMGRVDPLHQDQDDLEVEGEDVEIGGDHNEGEEGDVGETGIITLFCCSICSTPLAEFTLVISGYSIGFRGVFVVG